MHTITKGQRARINAYNTHYVEFIRANDALDAGILVAAHSAATWKTNHDHAECRCAGSGVFWSSRGPERRLADGRITTAIAGKCFGCNGKGFQSREDQARDWGYHTFYAK